MLYIRPARRNDEDFDRDERIFGFSADDDDEDEERLRGGEMWHTPRPRHY